jgi:hypothetical protein
VIDFEHPQPIQQISSTVGERIQACAQDHVLGYPVADQALYEVLGVTGSYTHPSAEGQQERWLHLGPQPVTQRQALDIGEIQRQIVVKHQRRRLLAMNGPGNRGQHRGAT